MYIVGFDAKGIMRNPISIEPDKTVLDARNAMIRYSISRIVIARGRKPTGILTEKDMARFLYSEVPRRRLDEIRLDEVMSRNLVTVDKETDLKECAKLMLQRQISSLIVVDSKKNLEGIFTKTDLVGAYVDYFVRRHTVREFMTKKVITVAPEEPIHMAILLMSGNEISRVVVARNKRVVGIITGRDLLPIGAYVRSDYRKRSQEIESMSGIMPSGIRASMIASDIMTPDPITTTKNSDLADSAYLMIRNRISGIPVVDSRHVLVGILTKTDVVGALAASR